MKNKLYLIVIILLGIFFLEVAIEYIVSSNIKKKFDKKYEIKLNTLKVKNEQKKKKLNDEFEINKYLATGKNVYERIYNNKKNDITELLQELTKESFPEDWECNIKVEEFTNFILLLQTPINYNDNNISKIVTYLIPIISYGTPYLKNVAVFNKEHECFLFFEEEVLNIIRTRKFLDKNIIVWVRKKGNNFVKYNSIKIDFNVYNGHIFIPVIVSGEDGIYAADFMLDTGASMSVISLELAQKTGHEDLNFVNQKTFSTARGLIECPLVLRKITISCIDINQFVAVNLEDNTNLLGMDFFKDKNYLIDTNSNCLYLWNR